ncbi:interferon-induced 6-16 family protein [Rhizoctonia solani AG-3 Rhs1AP]|uniref:Interferon-induced 6-16 family protein n=2 Tax=Rhizoctonia solani AG-3 TaxID=1086053 RepID=A0A074RSL0_9AGAM|nr:interferon-induced 6-16 family protein [Rhizoctonia solani AG-3 Rhs1AP]KEP48285.1 interferon-induced 6-16 family protein [Rhizoctonia solani 123E]
MDNFLNKIVNDPHVRAARNAVANLPPPVKKVAKAGMIGVGTGIAVFATPPLLGFTATGVAAGSLAAAIQSAVYGAAVPAGGLFAIMQSVGATATIVPALIAGASATGIVGAVEAGQEPEPGANEGDEEGGARDKEVDEQNENGDQEQRDEDKEQRLMGDEKALLGEPSSDNQKVSSHADIRIQVASPGEECNSMAHSLNIGQGEEVFRPRNNQS